MITLFLNILSYIECEIKFAFCGIELSLQFYKPFIHKNSILLYSFSIIFHLIYR